MENFLIALAVAIISGLLVGLIIRYLNKEKEEKLKTGVTQINKNTASMQNIYINVKNLNITDPQVTNFIEQLGEGISSTASTAQSMATTLKINVKDRINVSENVVTVLKPEDKEENK
jgi:mannitol-specific phosphotransferase system IIBC component